MNNRIPPSEKISKEIKGLIEKLDEKASNEDILGRVLKLGMEKIIQESLEEEAKQYLVLWLINSVTYFYYYSCRKCK